MPTKAKTKEHIPTLIDNNLHNLVVLHEATRAAIKSLETKKDKLADEIKLSANDIEGGKMLVRSSEFAATSIYQVNLVPGSNSHIDRDKLLERGVSPEVIAYATKQTSYTRLTVKENKQEKEDD